MSTHTFQLTGKAAEVYETQKVPAIFKPLAELIADQVQPTADDRVLDVACGTGIALRVIASRIPEIKRLVGTDLNPGMLEVARKLSKSTGIECEWHQADVVSLPFSASEFSICFCQQGLQFFPDKSAALKEMLRVLEPGGRLALSVWSEVSPLFEAMSKAFATHVGKETAERIMAPFAFRERPLIEDLLTTAGFGIDRVQTITVDRKIGPADKSFAQEIAGSPVAGDIEGIESAKLNQIFSDMADFLADYRTEEGFNIPQVSNLFLCAAKTRTM